MENINFFQIFWITLQGVISFLVIKYSFLLFAWGYRLFVLKNDYPRSWGPTSAFDDIWCRTRDSHELIEEIHALITDRIKKEDIPLLRLALGRARSHDSRWAECHVSGKDAYQHYGASEIEEFFQWHTLHEIKKLCETPENEMKFTSYRSRYFWPRIIKHIYEPDFTAKEEERILQSLKDSQQKKRKH